MQNRKVKYTLPIGWLVVAALIILVGLKIAGVITLSWWIIVPAILLFPLWMFWLACIIGFLFMAWLAFIAIVLAFLDKR